MNINELFDDLEKLKKEVWYLIKKVIPKLEEMISQGSSADLEKIKNQLDQQLSKIAEIESQIDSLNQKTEENTGSIETINSSMQTVSSQISDISSNLNDLENQITSTNQNLSSLSESVELVQNTLDSHSTSINQLGEIANGHTASIIDLISDVSDVNIKATEAKNIASSLETTVTNISNTVTGHTSQITNLQSSYESLNNSISTLSSSVNEMSSSITSLETEIEKAKKENCVVIYDMNSTDSAVNFGYTTGMFGTDYINYDFSPYHTLRIYARLYTSNCVQEVPVYNRKYTDVTLTAAASSPMIFCFLKVLLSTEPLLNKLQIGTYGRYSFISANNSLTFDSGINSTAFYVYRIEGIIK